MEPNYGALEDVVLSFFICFSRFHVDLQVRTKKGGRGTKLRTDLTGNILAYILRCY